MRFRPLLSLSLLLLLLPRPGLGSTLEFNGAWVAWLCPSGIEPRSGQCANFVLELMEKDGKLCGAHMFATAGAARIDEGAAPSITGDIVDGTVDGVAIRSLAASPVRLRVEIKLDNGVLSWKRLESPPGDYLLPRSARLTKAKSRTLLTPVFEQELRAACAYVFSSAARDRAPETELAPAMPAGMPSPTSAAPY